MREGLCIRYKDEGKLRWSYIVMTLLILSLMMTGCMKQGFLKNERNHKKNEIIVFAAASLSDCFTQIKKEYELEHLDVDIVLNFAGSQVLKNQILLGADPSMYFSANMNYPTELIEGITYQHLSLADIQVFAKNELVMISSDVNMTTMNVVMDTISHHESRIVLAQEDVPVGKYTRTMLNSMNSRMEYKYFYDNFYDQVVSYEHDVKAVLAKVKLKEADFGVVYRTDAMAASDVVSTIELPNDFNQLAEYGSLLLRRSDWETEFYHYIIEGNGQNTLKAFGFVTH